jgi:hypothetical protein
MNTIQPWLAGIAIGAGLSWLANKLPDILADWLDAEINKALAAGDAADDALILALCRWAEAKLPNGSSGEAKYQLVAQKLIALLPLPIRAFATPNTARIAQVIEANVAALQAELAKEAAKSPQPPPGAALPPTASK